MTAAAKLDLKNDSIIKLFFYYFIPALCAMLALSTYSTIDGIFVGQKIGTDGLAAIGACWAVFPACIAYELLFGFGGAAIVSYFLGSDRAARARLVFSSIFYFVAISSLAIGVLGFIFVDEILGFLTRGKDISSEIYALARIYLQITFLGMPFLILHPLSDIFVVNDKRPVLGMLAMILGSASNIALNYVFLFVLDMGIEGSALATILAHFIGFSVLVSHFVRKRGALFFIPRFSFAAIISSAKSGLPESISELSAAIMMVLYNGALLSIAGDVGLAVYSVVLYCGIVFFTILLSVSQALQPIASFNYGAGNFARLRYALFFSLFVVVVIGLLLYGVFYAFAPYFVGFFVDSSDEVAALSVKAMDIYYIGYVLLGVNMACAIFLQSIQRTISSIIITICYTFLFIALLLPPFSKSYGLDGAFASYPVAQGCALLVAVLVMGYELGYGILSGNAPSGRTLWKRRKHRV
ncbi:MATE family efflux transporter [Helicobacter canis]|uniref:Putative MATE efflux family protein n=1 Tax=Helicobacter canis TaxID=29419 RepID=A0A377JLL9_9HELI|nr:MATE family efflux transporter [Helicobacter canis]STP06446.1 putative MATE efflux family protein [Helicobacter canis]